MSAQPDLGPAADSHRRASADELVVPLEALLLDMDGTLVDSVAVVEAVWSELAAEHGLDAAAVLDFAHGRPARAIVARFLPHLDDAAQAEVVADLTAREEQRTDGVVATPGAGALLDAVAATGAPVALVTSAPPALAEARMTAAGLPVPEVRVTAADVTQGKPDPDGYRAAARRLGVDASRAVVVEDADAGAEAGDRAGAFVITVGAARVAYRPTRGVHVQDLRHVSLRRRGDGLEIVVSTAPSAIELASGSYRVRRAREEDVPTIVALLTDDVLGRGRESRDERVYLDAFRDIDDDPNQYLAVVEDEVGEPVATLQTTLIPGLSRGGARRLQVEAVRVAASQRSSGLGAALFDWVEAYARHRGASLIQLTSDKAREDAHRFYDRLGFTASHEGYKRQIELG